MDESVWQKGPLYLTLPKCQWPFSRDFLDMIPEQELRRPKALFNSLIATDTSCGLVTKLTDIVLGIMSSKHYTETTDFRSVPGLKIS